MIIIHKGTEELRIPITDFIPRILEGKPNLMKGLMYNYSWILEEMGRLTRLKNREASIEVEEFLGRNCCNAYRSSDDYLRNPIDFFLFLIPRGKYPIESERMRGGDSGFLEKFEYVNEKGSKPPKFGKVLYLDKAGGKLEIYKTVERGAFSAVAVPQGIVDDSLMETLDILGIPTFIFMNSFKEFNKKIEGSRVALVPLDVNMDLNDYLSLLDRGFKVFLPTYKPNISMKMVEFEEHSSNLMFSSMFPYARKEDVLNVLMHVIGKEYGDRILFQNVMDLLGPFPPIHTIIFRKSMAWEFNNSWAENYVLNGMIRGLLEKNLVYELRPFILKRGSEIFSLILGKNDRRVPLLIKRGMESNGISIFSNEDLKEIRSNPHKTFEYLREIKRNVLRRADGILKMFQLIVRKVLKEGRFDPLEFMLKVKLSDVDGGFAKLYLKHLPKNPEGNAFLKFLHQPSGKEWEIMVKLFEGSTDLVEIPKNTAEILGVTDGSKVIPIGLSYEKDAADVVLMRVEGSMRNGLVDFVRKNLSGIILRSGDNISVKYEGEHLNLSFSAPSSYSKEFFIGKDTRIILQKGRWDLHLFIEVSDRMSEVDVDVRELGRTFGFTGDKTDRMRAILVPLNIIFERISKLKVFDRIFIHLFSDRIKMLKMSGSKENFIPLGELKRLKRGILKFLVRYSVKNGSSGFDKNALLRYYDKIIKRYESGEEKGEPIIFIVISSESFLSSMGDILNLTRGRSLIMIAGRRVVKMKTDKFSNCFFLDKLNLNTLKEFLRRVESKLYV
ncbi:MAG: hypothetical protein ACTSR0_01175 [Candidatus Asgardarchaeia archaeon]